jgi:hypothetical protein
VSTRRPCCPTAWCWLQGDLAVAALSRAQNCTGLLRQRLRLRQQRHQQLHRRQLQRRHRQRLQLLQPHRRLHQPELQALHPGLLLRQGHARLQCLARLRSANWNSD